MRPNDEREFAKTVTALAATFRQESSAALIQGYWMGLSDLTLADIQSAAAKAIQTSKFMPTPRELRELASTMLPTDRAALAWDAAVNAVNFHGYYDSVDFDDRLINAVIRGMGGWMRFNERIEAEDNVWLRKEFEKLYATYARTGVGSEAVAYLGGFFEQQNAGRFAAHVRPPELIFTGLPPHPAGFLPEPTPWKQIAAMPEVDAAVKPAN